MKKEREILERRNKIEQMYYKDKVNVDTILLSEIFGVCRRVIYRDLKALNIDYRFKRRPNRFYRRVKPSTNYKILNLKELRRANKFSLEYLGMLMGVSKEAVRLWEKGLSMTTLENVEKLKGIFTNQEIRTQ